MDPLEQFTYNPNNLLRSVPEYAVAGVGTSLGVLHITGKTCGEPHEGDCPKDETSERLSQSPLHLLRKQELKNDTA